MNRFTTVSLVTLLAAWAFSPCPAQPPEAARLLALAQQSAGRGESRQAVEQATEALRQDSSLADAYYVRGRERFRLGQFAASADDFDRFVQLRPDQRARLWERGISCYYAGRFREGAEQFTAYQTFDDSDVENAVWHVLCLSRLDGLAAARRQMMRVKRDARVPMMQIDGLFRGEGTVERVLQAAAQQPETDNRRRAALFYAHLYVGLYFEAAGDEPRAREHLVQAAETYRIDHYMGDVARVHADRWQRAGDPDR